MEHDTMELTQIARVKTTKRPENGRTISETREGKEERDLKRRRKIFIKEKL